MIGQAKPAPQPESDAATADAVPVPPDTVDAPVEREIGGRDGPDPTRYGDWEKNGRCIDF